MARLRLSFDQSAQYLNNFWVKASGRDGRFSAYPGVAAAPEEPTPGRRPARRTRETMTRSAAARAAR